MSKTMRKSAIVGLIFLITFLFDFAIITETNENKQENNYNNKKMETTEPSCC